METNTLSVLQQLSSNPQLIGQLQNLLSLLSTGDQDGAVVLSSTAKPPSSSTTTSTSMSSPSMTTAVTSGGIPSPALAAPSSLVRIQQQEQGNTSGFHHPFTQTVSTTRSMRHGDVRRSHASYSVADTSANDGVSLQRYEQLAERYHQLEEQLEQKTREAVGATQRVSQLEKETTRLMRRVEQLVSVMEGQKQKLEENEAKHDLERAELMSRHEIEIRSKADRHEETIARLMKAKRLVTAAMQYEQRINTATRQGSVVTTPLNKGLQSHPNSSVKQQQQQQFQSDANNNNNNKRDGELEGDSNSVFASRVLSVKREREGTSNSLQATRRRRRTPRTPSPTVADRIAAASHQKKTPQSIKSGLDSPHMRTATSTFTEEQYAVSGRKPLSDTVSPGPATSTITEAMARHHHHQQQERQQRQNFTNHVESKFIAQFGAASLTPVPPAPLPLSTTVKSSLLTPSRTPRQRGGLPNSHQSQQQRPRSGQSSGTSSVVGGPTRSPSPVNPKRGAEQPRCFVVTSLTEEERARVRAAVAAVGQHGIVVESDYEEPPPFTATHIVVRGPPRSMKALCGVVASKWLVQPEYIYASRDAGFWLDEYEEGGLRCFPPPLKCQRFLLTMPDGIVKEKLEQVIEYGGGEVVRPAHDGRSYDQGVVVIASGDDLLRFATRME